MRHPDGMHKLTLIACLVTSALVLIFATIWGIRLLTLRNQATAQPTDVATAGFPLAGKPAPDFTLVDQFGRSESLSSWRGHEIVLAFIDSRCTSICPLTAETMYEARARLKSTSASQVELIAINANPAATSVAVVQSWSIKHGMLHQWLFLTGTAQQLQSVYHQYGVYVQVDASGQDVHDPAIFIIDGQGHERLFFETMNSNSPPDLTSEELGLEAGMQQWLPQPQ